MLLFVHKSLLLLVNLYLQVEIEVNLNLKVTLQTFVSNKSKFVCTFTFIYKFTFVHNFICNFTNKSILVCKSKSILVCISKLVCTSRNISEVNVYFFCVVGHMCESTLQFSCVCGFVIQKWFILFSLSFYFCHCIWSAGLTGWSRAAGREQRCGKCVCWVPASTVSWWPVSSWWCSYWLWNCSLMRSSYNVSIRRGSDPFRSQSGFRMRFYYLVVSTLT